MDGVMDFFGYIYNVLTNFADNSDTFWERVLIWIAIAYFEFKTSMIQFIFPIVSSMISQIAISDHILSSWGDVDSSIVNLLSYLRIPEGINQILAAFVTRFIMGMLP